MKTALAGLLLCFSLITQANAANYNNSDWRSMPFIQIMAAMMKAMNNIVGGNDSFSNFNSLPYSPAFFPIAGAVPGLNSFSNLPMSPAGFNQFPMNNYSGALGDTFKTGENQKNANFWDINNNNSFQLPTPTAQVRINDGINGIWQSLSGDVMAIYKNNRFLWSDGKARNLAGYLMIKDNKMIAYIPAKKATLYFQFYKEAGQFIVRDTRARIYTFKRLY